MEALSLLAAGASITQVTYDVGYSGPSGFSGVTLPAILGVLLTMWAIADARLKRANAS